MQKTNDFIVLLALSSGVVTANILVSNFKKLDDYNDVICDEEFTFGTAPTDSSCAMHCALEASCTAIFFNENNGNCSGIAGGPPDIHNCIDTTGTVFWIKPGYHGAPCSQSSECRLPNMECRLAQCSCGLGFSHRPRDDNCVTVCSELGTTLQAPPGFFLPGSNIECFTGECRASCLSDPTCLSYEYTAYDDACCTSYATVYTAGWSTNSGETYYQRNCA